VRKSAIVETPFQSEIDLRHAGGMDLAGKPWMINKKIDVLLGLVLRENRLISSSVFFMLLHY
jgi:hypothetical protein